MADLKIDEARARLWVSEVKIKLADVEQTLSKVTTARNSMVGDEDFVFSLIEKSCAMMETVWNKTSNAFKRGWETLEDGLGTFSRAGANIQQKFEDLKRQI